MKVIFKRKNLLIGLDSWHFQYRKYNEVYCKGFRLWFGFLYVHYLKYPLMQDY